jgi:hypothetical protein
MCPGKPMATTEVAAERAIMTNTMIESAVGRFFITAGHPKKREKMI